MTRCYVDLIDVRTSSRSDVGASVPAGAEDLDTFRPQQFIWRRRLYLVRRVLAAWIEVGVWWRDIAPERVPVPTGAEPSSSSAGDEFLVWRVEAGWGRFAPMGVYDISRDPQGAWTLIRAFD